MRRRIEITTIERERIVRFSGLLYCPACGAASEFLTVAQAALFAQVKVESIRRWLARSRAHGLKTSGGRYRVCKNSLFQKILPEVIEKESHR